MKSIFKLNLLKLTTVLFFTIALGNTKVFSQDYYIMIAKVYSKQMCGSASFSNAVAYDLEKLNGSFSYDQVKSDLKKRAARVNYVSESDVVVEGQPRQFACIIMYDKEHVGWGCSTKQFAIGYGDSEIQAENDAVKNMVNNYKRVTYFVQRRIDASMY